MRQLLLRSIAFLLSHMEAEKRATSTSTIDSSSVQAVLFGTRENVHLNNSCVYCQNVLKFCYRYSILLVFILVHHNNGIIMSLLLLVSVTNNKSYIIDDSCCFCVCVS